MRKRRQLEKTNHWKWCVFNSFWGFPKTSSGTLYLSIYIYICMLELFDGPRSTRRRVIKMMGLSMLMAPCHPPIKAKHGWGWAPWEQGNTHGWCKFGLNWRWRWHRNQLQISSDCLSCLVWVGDILLWHISVMTCQVTWDNIAVGTTETIKPSEVVAVFRCWWK